MKYVLLLMILAIPFSFAATENDAASAADKHVMERGIFTHRYFMLDNVMLFRSTYSVDENYYSFMYLALKNVNGVMKKARFIVSVNKESLNIHSIKIIKDKELLSPIISTF